MEKLSYRLTLASLFILAAGIFTSVSVTAASHVLIFIPGIYFSIKFYKERPFKLPKSFWALLAMCIAIIISVLLNTDSIARPLKNIFKIKYFVLSLLAIPAYFYTFKDFMQDKSKKVLLNTFVIATSIATLSGLIAVYTGFNPIKMKAACHETRACGLYGMYMTYGYGISLFMILLTGAILYREKFKNYINVNILYIAWIINFAGLYLSLARGAWLGYLGALPFFFFKSNKKTFLTVGLLAIITLAGSLAIPSVRKMFFDRQGSNDQRVAFYQTAFAAANEKPFFGYGYRNLEPSMIEIKKRHGIAYPNIEGHAHNNILEHLGSTGYIGALILLFFLGLWLYETFIFSAITFPFVVSFIISGMVQYTFGDGENLFMIMAIWALGSVFQTKICSHNI
ncbi:O-antigen ligase [Bacteriovorax sp. Seq25_V]|uniref:O-antigen ligase family protein n=1 Tax=Bacteriovorax sp. Seq25_V TaxID=1201288 RepID=UPI00038A1AAA|nr:O-antigen ligase family protein [Bacteriovorax sp. Seq25_V]EQC43367.1 O-antigen ligase [Bacteriovorax sp. Seq25_V]